MVVFSAESDISYVINIVDVVDVMLFVWQDSIFFFRVHVLE